MPPKTQGLLRFSTQAGKDVTVPIEKPVLTLGRSLGADIRFVEDLDVSRSHCVIKAKQGEYYIKDLKSRNGTFVNGKPVDDHHLQVGDRIQVGNREFIFERMKYHPQDEKTKKHKLSTCSKCGGIITDSEIIKGISERMNGEYVCSECSDKVRLKGKTFRDYMILEKIAQGGFGIVYKVKHKPDGTLAALKVIRQGRTADGETLNRFMREIRLGARINHPNIVRFFEAGEQDDMKYLVMEYCPGKPLSELLIERGEMLRELPKIAFQLFSALKKLHEHDIIHRDVKPDNILVDGKFNIKLIDFGLVKNLSSTGSLAITKKGEGIGTLHYIPSEQLKGSSEIDQRADIYGLGATFYEMACGQPPVTGKDFQEIVKAITSGTKTHICDINPLVPRKLGNCIMKAVHLKPSHRYAGIVEFKQAFSEALKEAGIKVPGRT